jgi:hypothetical protein
MYNVGTEGIMMSHEQMFTKRLSLIMAVLIIAMNLSPIVVCAAPANLTRSATYTFAEGNIARDPAVRQYAGRNINVLYNATTDTPNAVGIITNYHIITSSVQYERITLYMTDGVLPTSQANTGWNTWGSPLGTPQDPLYVVITWPGPHLIDATRVQWWQDDGGVFTPASATVEYWTGSAWTPVENMRDPGGTAVVSVGTARRGAWNAVTFDPVTTTRLRLRCIKSGTGTTGLGVGEWEVFGTPAVIEPQNISTDERVSIVALSVPGAGDAVYNPKFLLASNRDVKGSLIAVAYDSEGRLARLDSKPFDLAAGATAEVQASISTVAGNTYRFYIWDDAFKPLTAITVL